MTKPVEPPRQPEKTPPDDPQPVAAPARRRHDPQTEAFLRDSLRLLRRLRTGSGRR